MKLSNGTPVLSKEYGRNMNAKESFVITTDANNHNIKEIFDGLDRYKGSAWLDSSNNVHVLKQVIYDLFGNVNYDVDALENRTEYQYDNLGRQTKVIFPPIPNQPASIASTWYGSKYSIDINLASPSDYNPAWTTYVKSQDPDGNVTYQGYDILGRIIWTAQPIPTEKKLVTAIHLQEISSQ